MKWASIRPSPALVIASVALVIAASGTAVAATALVSGDALIKKNSLSGNRLKNHTVTGTQVNLKKLGKVPSAAKADAATTAGTATSATSATNANHSTSADSATNATNATNANHAGTADTLTPLPSGQSESGAFSGAGGTSTGGWYGFDITYQRPLATAIADNHIIDTFKNPDATHCPGPGHASAGYLCLYFQYHDNTGTIYGYSTDAPYSNVSPSVGVGLYGPIAGAFAFANGVWTVTAP
jgi:hypothetical protein